ncbi:MAG: DUF6247 family protein [Pseudonocardiaceae bacterium]
MSVIDTPVRRSVCRPATGQARHNVRMSVANIKIGRSGSAVRAVLADVAPDECAEFEAEFHATMAEVDDNFDTSRVDALVRRWWARAVVLLNPGSRGRRCVGARQSRRHVGPGRTMASAAGRRPARLSQGPTGPVGVRTHAADCRGVTCRCIAWCGSAMPRNSSTPCLRPCGSPSWRRSDCFSRIRHTTEYIARRPTTTRPTSSTGLSCMPSSGHSHRAGVPRAGPLAKLIVGVGRGVVGFRGRWPWVG